MSQFFDVLRDIKMEHCIKMDLLQIKLSRLSISRVSGSRHVFVTRTASHLTWLDVLLATTYQIVSRIPLLLIFAKIHKKCPNTIFLWSVFSHIRTRINPIFQHFRYNQCSKNQQVFLEISKFWFLHHHNVNGHKTWQHGDLPRRLITHKVKQPYNQVVLWVHVTN